MVWFTRLTCTHLCYSCKHLTACAKNGESLLLSEQEKRFIAQGIEKNVREDGRSCRDMRHITVTTGDVSSTSGSSRLQMNGNDVVVGVKAEIGQPNSTSRDKGIIKFSVDCSAVASPEFEGRGADDLSNTISHTLSQLYNHPSALDLASLCIVPDEQCWILYVDALVLQHGGNMVDALSFATLAALTNTRIPSLHVNRGEDGEAVEIEVSDDPSDCHPLDLSGVPVTVTLSKIGSSCVVDTTAKEEMCTDASLVVGINRNGRVCSLQKTGSGTLSLVLMTDMIETAKTIGSEVISSIETVASRSRKESADTDVSFLVS